MENLKRRAAEQATKLVESSMIVGLGTGSTAACFVTELGKRIASGELQDITGVTTSFETERLAREAQIPLVSLKNVHEVDLLIDGVDEVTETLDGIKGGGGALLMEKIVASYTREYVWIADDSKLSPRLGTKFKLPVEVVHYGATNLFNKFEAIGYQPEWRLTPYGERFATDQQHYIIDLHFSDGIADAQKLAYELDTTVGVVEHGLFLNMAKEVILAGTDGIRTLTA
ncbi:MAG: ribose-5-phosphate isomerase RpiA [Streptococcaceae bacterium]|jgi:ribose 5-phosphate isomerase A|nr:ribose-5-phosphate isomerase RpiA [Streptococcaceae bacterium]